MGALWMQDIRRLFTKKKLLWAAAGLLLIVCLCFAAGKESGEADISERVSIGIVNLDTSIYSQMLLSFYEENGLFTSYVSVYIDDEETIKAWFDEGRLDMYLLIPEDFADSMTYLEHLPVQAVISAKNPVIEIMLKNLLESYEKYIASVEIHCVALYDVMLMSGMTREQASQMNEKISVQLILKALSKSDFFERYILENYSAIKLIPFYIHEAVLLALTFLALLFGVRFQKEHHAGIYVRLNAMGVGEMRILAQKQLFFGAELAVFAALCYAVLKAAGQDVLRRTVVLFWLYGWLMGAAMLFLAAAFQKTKNYLLASTMFLLLGAILGGGLIPFMYLPAGMQRIARFLPNYRALRLLFDAEAGRLSAGQTAWIAAGAVVCAALLLLFAAGLYRRREGQVYENA